jgi:hypothetical protein
MATSRVKLARVRRQENANDGPVIVIRDIYVDGELWGHIHQQGDPSADSTEKCARYHVVYQGFRLSTAYYLDLARNWVIQKIEKQGPSGSWLTRMVNTRTKPSPPTPVQIGHPLELGSADAWQATQPPPIPVKVGHPLEPFFSKLVGVTHLNEDGSPRQAIIKECRSGERLRLVREPNNQYDPCAVAVHRLTGEQLGYLSRDVAAEIAPRLDRGSPVDVEVAQVTGGGWWIFRKTRGINVRITKYSMR